MSFDVPGNSCLKKFKIFFANVLTFRQIYGTMFTVRNKTRSNGKGKFI